MAFQRQRQKLVTDRAKAMGEEGRKTAESVGPEQLSGADQEAGMCWGLIPDHTHGLRTVSLQAPGSDVFFNYLFFSGSEGNI